MKNETKGLLLGLFGVTAFALTLPITRSIISAFDPVFIACGRGVIAGLLGGIWILMRKPKLPVRKQWLPLIITALGVVFGFPLFSAIAMQSVPASHGGVVLGLLPLITAVFGAVIYGERPSLAFWLACIVGSGLVVVYSLLQGGGHLQLGDFWLLASVASAALGYAVGANLSKQIGGLQVISWALIISFPFLLIVSLYTFPTGFFTISMGEWSGFLYLSIVSQWLGFLFWYQGLALGGIARVSQVQLLQPFITLFASVIIVGELIGLTTIIFALVVVMIVGFGRYLKAA
jgi:drug/metabolite transporter (DMT)-like permease